MSCWLLAIYVPKSDKLLLIIQKASISNYRCHAIKYSCPKKLVLKSFLDTILQSRSLCYGQNRRNYQIVFKHYEAFCVLKQWNTYVTEMNSGGKTMWFKLLIKSLVFSMLLGGKISNEYLGFEIIIFLWFNQRIYPSKKII